MTDRQIYIRHIRRLQAENRILRAVIADERIERVRAYQWYRRKVRSWLWMTMEAMILGLRRR
jgi:hypothetical protein